MSKQTEVKILPVGDCALLVEFGREVNEKLNDQVRALCDAVLAAGYPWLEDVVPAYASLLVSWEAGATDFTAASAAVEHLLAVLSERSSEQKRIWAIPVCYEGEFAPDMADMEQLCGLSAAEIIRLHSGRDYKIYMLGFLPGFAYLGGLDKKIHAPRLQTPRVRIEAGSVGIGGAQTGIYPLASPGGWRLIGKTPLPLYDPDRAEPIFYQAGDFVRFLPISAKAFDHLAAEVAAGRWQPQLCDGEVAR